MHRSSEQPVEGPQGDPVDTIIAQWRHERPDLDPAPMAVFGRIARIFALQRQSQEAVLSQVQLPHPAFDVLANLRRTPAPHRKSASRLAESSMISTGGVTMRLDTLEAAGLVRRVRDASDRRLVLAELTDEGAELIDRAIELHLAEEHRIISHLTERERELLASLLAKLEAALVSCRNASPDPASRPDREEAKVHAVAPTRD